MITTKHSGLIGVAALSWALGVAGTQQFARAEGWRLVVQDPLPTKVESPIVVEVPATIPVGDYEASTTGRSRPIAVQVFDDLGKRWLCMVPPPGANEGPYNLRAIPASGNDPTHGFSLEPKGARIVIRLNHDRVTEYRTDQGAKPFLFPLIGPTGASYTRTFPMARIAGEDHDHPHQRSFWFTHGKVNGVDFWSEEKGHGTIKETSRQTMVSGPLLARLRTTDDWIAPDGKKVCSDDRVLTFTHSESARIVDFEITIKADHGPVVFGDTKEGMFGLRIASSMDVNRKKGGKITNAEGLTDERAWGKASPWVDYTGPVAGKTVGIAILNHPRSFRYPTTWHVRTYGLFAANPFGWHDFGLGKSGEYTLGAGESLWFGYRVILHTGETTSARIPEAFANYSQPVKIEIKKN
ncbi:MAG: PmoA family protein [Isosphaeraceae bacterium]